MLTWQNVLLRLGLAALFGLLVGVERERRAQFAGMRTMALVAVGAGLFALISIYPYPDIITAEQAHIEPTRIIAQIVTGIGFLGAGTIWMRKSLVHGLTTAAALWVVAAVGTACGVGLWIPAGGAVVVMLLVLLGVRPIERWLFPERTAGVIRLWVSAEPGAVDVLERAYAVCQRAGLRITSFGAQPATGHDQKDVEILEMRFRTGAGHGATAAAAELRRLAGVRAVRVTTAEQAT
jgi:putative Mg2+ transporter-C (MgtC) family protein